MLVENESFGTTVLLFVLNSVLRNDLAELLTGKRGEEEEEEEERESNMERAQVDSDAAIEKIGALMHSGVVCCSSSWHRKRKESFVRGVDIETGSSCTTI